MSHPKTVARDKESQQIREANSVSDGDGRRKKNPKLQQKDLETQRKKGH